MFLKNLQFAFKVFKKNKATTAINILGLAVGISAAIVIFLIVRYDYSFDKWEPQKENIYRVVTKYYLGNNDWETNQGVSLLAPEAIKNNIAGIETVSHFINSNFDDLTVTVPASAGKTKIFHNNEDVVFADDNYFKIFPHQWVSGNPASSLSQVHQVVLSVSSAKKFFPNQNINKIIGQRLAFNDSIDAVVTGIVADLKAHTDFNNKIFISLKTFTRTSLENSMGSVGWTDVNGSSQCFIKLYTGSNVANVSKQINALWKSKQKGEDEFGAHKPALQPLNDIHFNTKIDGTADKSTLLELGILALFLLLLAAINFINLSTAQSTLRAKEIGIRKTFGGNNKQIIYQFLTETFLITVCATLLAIIISPFLIYIFKGFIPEGLSVKEMFQPVIIVFLIIIIIAVTFLSGLYPAFILTKFSPALVMKNQVVNKGKSRSTWVREVLTVSQFVIAQVFLVIVLVIGKQIHFMLNKNLGFRKEAIISFYIPDYHLGAKSKKTILYDELKRIPEIQNVTLCNATPTIHGWSSTSLDWNNKGKNQTFDNVQERVADSNYIKLFDMQLLAGKNILVRDTSNKITDVLINETLLHQMGYKNPQDAIGQYLSGGYSDSSQIVGVLKNYTVKSLHTSIEPVALWADDHSFSYVMAEAFNPSDPSSWQTAINKTEKIFKSIYPNNVFDYTFLDKTIEGLYKSDIRLSTLLKWATGLAIFISCLGLLGLVSFMANQRTKEIGIRKVLGASVMQIITLLSKSLVKLVVLASVIAFPIAWYFSHKWLQDFAFKTTVSWWIFFISGIGMLLIALAVLCLRAMKAARANPVDCLKDE